MRHTGYARRGVKFLANSVVTTFEIFVTVGDDNTLTPEEKVNR